MSHVMDALTQISTAPPGHTLTHQFSLMWHAVALALLPSPRTTRPLYILLPGIMLGVKYISTKCSTSHSTSHCQDGIVVAVKHTVQHAVHKYSDMIYKYRKHERRYCYDTAVHYLLGTQLPLHVYMYRCRYCYGTSAISQQW